MWSVRLGVWRDAPTSATAPPWRAPAGLKILVPGYVQWSWRQRERAVVLFGSYVVAVGVGIFAWGTWTGLAVLAFAFAAHVVSAVDVVRQSAFPGFGRWMPLLSTSGGLALGVYAPALYLASLSAWPVMYGAGGTDGYLVDCRAYRAQAPARGDWLWLRSSPWGDLRVGRVVAEPGQEVEWSANQLRIDGRKTWVGSPFRAVWPPEDLAFAVPKGHVLVNPETDESPRGPSGGLVLVPKEQVAGRVWARMYPLSKRRVLP